METKEIFELDSNGESSSSKSSDSFIESNLSDFISEDLSEDNLSKVDELNEEESPPLPSRE